MVTYKLRKTINISRNGILMFDWLSHHSACCGHSCGCFIYILDCSNSSSFIFWSSKLAPLEATEPVSEPEVIQIVSRSRVARHYCYKKKAASIGQIGRHSACCNFFSSWLIRPWGTTNQISDHAAPTVEFS